MKKYDKIELGKTAKSLGFVRDTFEKVDRLVKILGFINNTPAISGMLALKGGTAINLTVFNLPRLSVDIDLDFTERCDRDEMIKKRKVISDILTKYMESEGYILSPKTKTPHSLDSYVYTYINSGGVKDNIKIEINYSMRHHIFEPCIRLIETNELFDKIPIRTLAPIEIFASKINALISRAAARDLYDISNMIKYNLFDESESELLKKCELFYMAVGGKDIPRQITFDNLDRITPMMIKRDLYPVIRLGDGFELKSAKEKVTEYLKDLMNLSPMEQEFLMNFAKGKYKPELLFEDKDILDRIVNHPMAKWKIGHINEMHIER